MDASVACCSLTQNGAGERCSSAAPFKTQALEERAANQQLYRATESYQASTASSHVVSRAISSGARRILLPAASRLQRRRVVFE